MIDITKLITFYQIPRRYRVPGYLVLLLLAAAGQALVESQEIPASAQRCASCTAPVGTAEGYWPGRERGWVRPGNSGDGGSPKRVLFPPVDLAVTSHLFKI